MILAVLLSLVLYLLGQGIISNNILFPVMFAGFLLAIILDKNHNHDNMLIIENLSNKSTFRNVNPIGKLVFTIMLIFFVVYTRSITISSLVIISTILFFIYVSRLELSIYFGLIEPALLFILISIIGLIISITRIQPESGGLNIFGFYLSITRNAQEDGLRLFLLSLASVSLLINFALVTPIGDIIFALKKLKCPKLLIEIMYLIYRYIFILSYLLNSMQASGNSRLGFVSLKNTFRSSKYIASRLFNKSIRMALDSYSAMESRMYVGDIEFLERKYSKTNALYFALVYGLGLIIIWLMVK